jgi:hypothetical protein
MVMMMVMMVVDHDDDEYDGDDDGYDDDGDDYDGDDDGYDRNTMRTTMMMMRQAVVMQLGRQLLCTPQATNTHIFAPTPGCDIQLAHKPSVQACDGFTNSLRIFCMVRGGVSPFSLNT